MAPAYFNELKKAVKRNVTVWVDKARCSESSPAQVVLRAERHLKELADPEDRQSVWVLFDREGDKKQCAIADEEKRKAIESGIKVAVSQPCYDLWTLLHFEDTGAFFADCKRVVTRALRHYNKQYGTRVDDKTEVEHSKLIVHRSQASSRAKKHHESNDQSWTEVYKVVEEIDNFLSGDPTEEPD